MRGITKMTLANRSREGGNRGGSMETNNRGGNQGGSMEMNGRGGNSGMNNAYNAMETQTGGAQGNYGPENRRDSRGRYAPRNEGMDNAYGAYNRGMEGAYNEGGSMRMGGDKGWVVKPIEDRMDGPENWMPPYWETRAEGGSDVNSRFRDRRGRQHYNNGRFAPMRSAYEGEMEDRMPPIYNPGNNYRNDESGERMIGFYGGMRGQDELSSYRNKHQSGHASSEIEPLDRKKAHEWVSKMKNSDGSTGEHWTYDQTTQVMKQRNIDCEPAEFYTVMNMLWSDYGAVAKKFGVDNLEYWSELSKSFLKDKDAEHDKLALYYECIVKK